MNDLIDQQKLKQFGPIKVTLSGIEIDSIDKQFEIDSSSNLVTVSGIETFNKLEQLNRTKLLRIVIEDGKEKDINLVQ